MVEPRLGGLGWHPTSCVMVGPRTLCILGWHPISCVVVGPRTLCMLGRHSTGGAATCQTSPLCPWNAAFCLKRSGLGRGSVILLWKEASSFHHPRDCHAGERRDVMLSQATADNTVAQIRTKEVEALAQPRTAMCRMHQEMSEPGPHPSTRRPVMVLVVATNLSSFSSTSINTCSFCPGSEVVCVITRCKYVTSY